MKNHNREKCFAVTDIKADASATTPLNFQVAAPSTGRVRLVYEVSVEDGGYTSFVSSIAVDSAGSTLTAICLDRNSDNTASTVFSDNPTLTGVGSVKFRSLIATHNPTLNSEDIFGEIILEAGSHYLISFTPLTATCVAGVTAVVYEE